MSTCYQLVTQAGGLFRSACKKSQHYKPLFAGRPKVLGDVSAMVDLLEQGLSIGEVANRLGVHRNTVMRYLDEAHSSEILNIPSRKNIPQLIAEARSHARRCFRRSVSYARRIGRPEVLNHDTVVGLVASGFSQRVIAEKLGCHRNTVDRVVQQVRTKISGKCPCGRAAGHKYWCSFKNTDSYAAKLQGEAARRPYQFFFGFLPGASMHRNAVPKYKHCIVRGCPYPSSDNEQSLCHHHFHFFDYKMSLLGRDVDMEDMYGTEDRTPLLYVSWFWKHDLEGLRFENRGTTSWWKSRLIDIRRMDEYDKATCRRKVPYGTQEEAKQSLLAQELHLKPREDAECVHVYSCPVCEKWHIGNKRTVFSRMAAGDVKMDVSVPGLHRGVSGTHHGKRAHRKGAKASQRARHKAMVENRVGNKRTPQKPVKRWSREELEIQADQIIAASEARNGEISGAAEDAEREYLIQQLIAEQEADMEQWFVATTEAHTEEYTDEAR